MIKPIRIRDLFDKDIKVLCFIISAIYFIFSAFSLASILMHKLVAQSVASEEFNSMMKPLHEIWVFYMPILLLISIAYYLFGRYFHRIKGNKLHIHLLLSILSFFWFVGYAIAVFQHLKVMVGFNADEPYMFDYVTYLAAGMGLIVFATLFIAPQFIIGRKIQREQQVD